MYKIEYLQVAKNDIKDIITYISKELLNPVSAQNLLNDMINKIENLKDFPYSNPVYYPIKPLKKEYRKLIIKNYIVFYSVDETSKIITISRVIYAQTNYSKNGSLL